MVVRLRVNSPAKTFGSAAFFPIKTWPALFITILSLLFFPVIQSEGQTSQTFTANGTFTVPAGVTSITVECWGGGGAGGGATGNPAAGGGGAGGAYVRSILTVVPGTAYTVNVAGMITGNSTNTAAQNKGYPSWFGTVGTIYAAGGDGGAPATNNNTNGAAGAGNTTGCIGGTMYRGGSGATGIYTSGTPGGAGGGGAGSTGVGGNATTGTGGTGTTLNGGAGANGVANSTAGAQGSNYGGGGSGGKANGNTDRAGGNGAPGLVIVSWTCPTYSLTATSATNTCTPNNSTVTLTSTAAGLPVGTYNVTYNTSNPLQTGLTATMTVTTAGTGTFTATGLTAAGNCTINITTLSSGVIAPAVCSSVIAANNTATITVSTVPAQPSAITGPVNPCPGPNQVYSVTNVPGVTYTWVLPAGWTKTAGGTTNSITVTTTATAGTITVTPSNACGNGTPSTLAVTPVTIPAQPSVITGTTPVCAGSSQTYSVTNVAGLTYTWTFPAGWTQTGGGTTNSVTVTVGTAGGNITVIASNSCGNSPQRTLAVTVNPMPQGSLTANGPLCATGTGTLTWTSTLGTGPFTVVYNDGTANRTQTNVTSGVAFNAAVNPVTATTTYTVVSVTGANGCVRSSGFTGGSATIIVNPAPQGSLAGSSICTGGTGRFTFTATSGTGPFTLLISGQTYNGVQSGVPFNANPNPGGTTTYILSSIIDANSCFRTTGIAGPNATITVNPTPQGSLSGNTICSGGIGEFTFVASSGTGPFSLVINGQNYNGVVSGIPFIALPNPGVTTAYTLTSITDANACSRTSGITQPSATITVTPGPTATITYPGAPFCITETNPQAVSLTGTGTYLGGTFSSAPIGLTLNSGTGAIVPSTSTPGLYTITYTIPAFGGCASLPVTTTVDIRSITPATISTSLLNYCGTLTGGPLGGNTPTYGTGTWSQVSGPGTTVFSSPNNGSTNVTASAYGTYVYQWTITNPPCAPSSAQITVNFYATPTGATVAATPLNFCRNLLTGSLGGNTPVVGTGLWTKVSGPGTVTFTAPNSGSSTALVSAYGTYVLQWTISNGTCAPTSAQVTLNFYASPTTATISVTPLTYCGTLTTAPLGGNTPAIGTGFWSQVSGPGTTSFADPTSGSTTATATVYGTYVYQWAISNGTCTPSTALLTVTYTALPTTATISTSPLNYCGTLISGNLGGNTPVTGTGAWSQVSGPGTTVFSAPSSGSSTATASLYGTYVYQWSISNGSCAPSTAQITVNYYALPTPASITASPLNYCGTLTSNPLGGNVPAIGTGTWTQVSGPGTTSFSAVNSGSSTATATAYGTYVYQWTIANGTCPTSSAQVTVIYSATPTTATIAVPSLDYCGTLTSGSLGGNTPIDGTGLWSQVSGPGTTTFSAPSSGSSTATATLYGT